MFTTIPHFLAAWQQESTNTTRVFDALTDASLAQRVAPGHRSLGELAWHLVVSQKEIMGKTGLAYEAPTKATAVPSGGAAGIRDAYVAAARALANAVATQWDDAALAVEDELYGMRWRRGLTALVMLSHEIHHRGQMTVLMRQAGVAVPRVYG
jgi:uncharacterized damage-inducible protein DinB